MTSLYLKIGAGLVIALLAGFGGFKLGSNHWQTRYNDLQAENWQAKAMGERVVRKAVEAQLAQSQATFRNNAQVLRDLQDTTASIAADRDHSRDLVRRLLASAARPSPASSPVPEAGHQSGTAPAGAAGSPVEVGELLTDAAIECRNNAAQLNALIDQIRPQL